MRATRWAWGILVAAPVVLVVARALPAEGGAAAARRSTGSLESGVELVLAPDVERRLAALAPAEIRADLSPLSRRERGALAEIVAAARELNPIFRRQVWSGNAQLEAELARARGEHAAAAREYYRIMQGPWDRLDADRPFVGTLAKPMGAGYYPEDMSRAEFEAWLAAHPGDRAAFALRAHPDRARGRWPARGALRRVLPRTARARRRPPARGRGETGQRQPAALPRDARRGRSRPTTTTRATSRGWTSRRPSRSRSAPTRPTRTDSSASRRRSRPSSRSPIPAESERARPLQGGAAVARAQPAHPRRRQEPQSRHREPDPRRRRGLQPPARPTAASRPSPSTCPTTNGCARRRARRRSCCATSWAKFAHILRRSRSGPDRRGRSPGHLRGLLRQSCGTS